jgi:hypothetical protein
MKYHITKMICHVTKYVDKSFMGKAWAPGPGLGPGLLERRDKGWEGDSPGPRPGSGARAWLMRDIYTYFLE